MNNNDSLPDYKPDMGTMKLKELILFLSKLSMDDPKFGAIKLNKLLFYCDFEAYRKFGKSITGKIYENLAEGPVPKCLVPVREEMINIDESLVISHISYYNQKQIRVVPLRDPNLDLFSSWEIETIHDIFEENKPLNGREITLKSHRFIGWRITKLREEIDYRMALIGDRLPTEEEIKYGSTL